MTVWLKATRPPTEIYTSDQISRAFGLEDEISDQRMSPIFSAVQISRRFGLGDAMTDPFAPSPPADDTTMKTIGIAGFLGVLALGIVGTGLTTYFVWRVAKKQRWV